MTAKQTTIGVGLDFGTTNSALALARADGRTDLAHFASRTSSTPSFRSVLFYGREDDESPVESCAGPRAIERYLEMEGERRLMQSLKSFLASRLFNATQVFGRRTRLEGLVTRMLTQLIEEAREVLGGIDEGIPMVVGRPVRFAKAKRPEDDDFAVSRLQEALRQTGIRDFHFEFEPVAAAYHYERDLERDELLLIADFGGGTSDFCLLPVGPGHRSQPRSSQDILGTAGVARAGDAFDAKIVRHLIAPRLGRGSTHRNEIGEVLPVPSWLYADLERWHHLSFLRSKSTLALLHQVRDSADEPEKIAALLEIVEEDLGYALYRSVERAKTEISEREETVVRFEGSSVQIAAPLSRRDFEAWISEEVAAIAACVDGLLEETGIAPERVDRVFLTGGSSFVPVVRALFEDRFGADRIRGGEELTSVASGLALRAADLARVA